MGFAVISIHAPREGGDGFMYGTNIAKNDISIHAPREGGDYGRGPDRQRARHFNPRPPRGGRLAFNQFPYSNYHISIHAPREGGDMAISMKLSLRC